MKEKHLRCIDCGWCRPDVKYEAEESYVCLKCKKPLRDPELWKKPCPSFKPKLRPEADV